MTERRFAPLETEITGNKLGGYAAVFNTITDIGQYREQLLPTAFDKVLGQPHNVAGLLNHDPNMLLARTTNGSLRLSTDSTGLAFELDLPDTTTGRDVREMVASGLITQCSFAFVAGEQSWTENRTLRTHSSLANVTDVSVVTNPAYPTTSVSVRSATDVDLTTQIIRARARANRKVK
ncbi:HK97 family phage prohead protease [Mycobacterium sp. OTB74]|jgi:HK97 family phage prohead protease|uniref:HK97 family phage prohead protease n=1 Tax=Mycobacterium sp. OTB74 TaxID=1853452 RepID=UPI00247676C1|nr:HK97 family phage prohead protease [Mycobacterium sp. OTB74]MDH6242535.1 HK97 family phage prohead protease [Mycobacterium sp. OTB74]